jgi:agmatine deiminase
MKPVMPGIMACHSHIGRRAEQGVHQMDQNTQSFRMPAEWMPHQRTFVSWPVKESMCRPDSWERVCAGYAEIIRAITEFEPVTVLINMDDFSLAKKYCGTGRIDWLPLPHDDSWLRDNGPTFLVDGHGGRAAVNWQFNAWGGKYSPCGLDDGVSEILLDRYGIQSINAPLVMEGGSFHTDGEGTLLTTEECLMNPNRNPGLSRDAIAAHLQHYLGASRIVWLKRGLDGDETDGHVDNIACFAAPGKILIQTCADERDRNHSISLENLAILQEAKDAKERCFEIVEIPQPPMRMGEGGRLVLSYLNFYFVNGGIILPVFGGDAADSDREAERILAATFPHRRIRTVDGMAIVTEGGNVHCATQQMPM